jgi:hypothetical protein
MLGLVVIGVFTVSFGQFVYYVCITLLLLQADFFWPILRDFKVVLCVFVNVKCEEHLCFVHLTASLAINVRKL